MSNNSYKFYILWASWCPHCQKIKRGSEEYNKLENNIEKFNRTHKDKLQLLNFEEKEFQKIVESNDSSIPRSIKDMHDGWPGLYLYKSNGDSEIIKPYVGARTADTILSWIESTLNNNTKNISNIKGGKKGGKKEHDKVYYKDKYLKLREKYKKLYRIYKDQ